MGVDIPVRCVETGIVYKSLNAVATSFGVKSNSGISKATKCGKTYHGFHFEYITDITSNKSHLCPDCAKMDCRWWRDLTPKTGAETAIKGTKDGDRLIVIKCPEFTAEVKR